MKKSRQVPASLIIAIASTLAVTGCESNTVRMCVDNQGKTLPDSTCNSGGTTGAHWVTVQRQGYGSSGHYYGGYGGGYGGYGGSGGGFGG